MRSPAVDALTPSDDEVALAREHPRGTEKGKLWALLGALASPAAYAALTPRRRDEIVRWAEARRRIRVEHGIDANTANMVETLVPEAHLRALVVEGEVAATAVAAGPREARALTRAEWVRLAADVPRFVAEAEREGLPAIVAAIRDAVSPPGC